LQIIRDVPLAVRITTDGAESANRFFIGRDGPDDLIEPTKIIGGTFTYIVLVLFGRDLPIDRYEFQFNATNPTQAQVALAIREQVVSRSDFQRTEIHSRNNIGTLLGFVCRPLP
jgi:hypothetical protein